MGADWSRRWEFHLFGDESDECQRGDGDHYQPFSIERLPQRRRRDKLEQNRRNPHDLCIGCRRFRFFDTLRYYEFPLLPFNRWRSKLDRSITAFLGGVGLLRLCSPDGQQQSLCRRIHF